MTAETLLDQVMPRAEFKGRISIPVHASRDALLRAFREVTLDELPIARAVGNLRYLPGRLLGRSAKEPPHTEPFLQQLIAGGNILLAEEPGREIVVGGIGKFHQILDQEPVRLRDAAEFRAFDDARYQKLAMGLRVEEDARGAHLVLEHRTHALGRDSRRAFWRYWLVIKPMGHFVTWLLLRAVRRRAESASSSHGQELSDAVLG